MEIEELDGPTKYETMPAEGVIYLTAVRYAGGGGWMAGPGGMDKNMILQLLAGWHGIDAARIYAVKVPLNALPAA